MKESQIQILSILCLVATPFADDRDPIVTLPDGKIRGHTLLSENGNVFYAFQEIPYAAPPVGELRFKPPEPPKAWNGILDTKENTKVCYQAYQYFSLPKTVAQTEDCLYLNVYAPQRPGSSSALLPVFVWIHGGAFNTGGGIIEYFGPKFLIDTDLVIVTINYRLGPLGFLNTNDGVIPGNLGLRDQNLAFQWVNQNIELFGGDPEKVTIAGESAGAMSVGFQLLSKKSEGLFRAAILESGTALAPGVYQNSSKYVALALAKNLDPSFTSDDSNDLLDLLRNVSAADISYNNLTISDDPNAVGSLWVPVIESDENEDAFVTGFMHENIKNGDFNQVPIILGFNSEEGLLPLILSPDSSGASGLLQEGMLYDADPSLLLKLAFTIKEEDGVKSGEAIRQIYTDTTFQDSFQGLVSYKSDYTFTTPAIRQAVLQSQYTDVFLYQFSYKGNLTGFNQPIEGVDSNGVAHMEEIFYIWDVGIYSDSNQFPEQDIPARSRTLKLWSNFIKHLNPTPEEDELLQNVTWPKVTSDEITYLNINTTLEVNVDPKQYKKWEKIIDTYALPPFITY